MKYLFPILILFSAGFILQACLKDEAEPEPEPVEQFSIDSLVITNLEIIDTTARSPEIKISFYAENSAREDISEFGFVWADHVEPSVSDNIVSKSVDLDDRKFLHADTLSIAERGTTIYIRAFVKGEENQIFYSAEEILEIKKLPLILSNTKSLFIGPYSATVLASMSPGSFDVSEWGVIYDVQPIANETQGTKTSFRDPISVGESAADTVRLNDLTKLTKYYARFYAITSEGTSLSDQIEFTTANTNEWVLSPSPFTRFTGQWPSILWNSIATINGIAYVGIWEAAQKVYFRSYNPSTGKWRDVTEFPGEVNLEYALNTYDDNSIYMGVGYINSYDGSIWKYDLEGNHWMKLPPIPLMTFRNARPVSFTIDNKFFVGYGKRSDKYFDNRLFQYLPLEEEWLPLSSMDWIHHDWYNFGIVHFSQGFDDHAIFILSHSPDPPNVLTTYRYDYATHKTIVVPTPTFFTSNPDLTVRSKSAKSNGKGYIVTDFPRKLIVYNSLDESWSEIPIPNNIYASNCFVIDDTIYLFDSSEAYSYTIE